MSSADHITKCLFLALRESSLESLILLIKSQKPPAPTLQLTRTQYKWTTPIERMMLVAEQHSHCQLVIQKSSKHLFLVVFWMDDDEIFQTLLLCLMCRCCLSQQWWGYLPPGTRSACNGFSLGWPAVLFCVDFRLSGTYFSRNKYRFVWQQTAESSNWETW